MLTDKQPKSTFSSPSSSGPAPRWNGDSNVSMLFPANFLEPTMPETFLELDPAGFFSHSSNHSTASKGTCVFAGFNRASSSQPAINCLLEPSREPCTDDIPWSDLVFWLGNASTGEVVCSCAQCTRRVMRGYSANLLRQQRYSPYQQQQLQQHQRRRVSSRVPVINMPRIEGVN